MADSPFRIDVLDSAGQQIGSGPLTTITQLADNQNLDRIGTVRFSLPAADPAARSIQAGRQFDVYDDQDGYLGRFIFDGSDVRVRNNVATLDVRADSVVDELRRQFVGFRRSYDQQTVQSVIDDLIAIVAGWTIEADSGLGSTSVTYEGSTVYASIAKLAEQLKLHIRIKAATSKTLEFKALGAASGVRFVNVPTQALNSVLQTPNLAGIRVVNYKQDTSELINRLIPVGAGQGDVELTIEGTTVGTYTTQTGTNKDGSNYYYIEDAASIAAYGVYEQPVKLTRHRPLFNNQTSIGYARDALKIDADAILDRHKDPRETLNVEVYGLTDNPQPGDKVHVDFVGAIEGEPNYVHIKGDYYVLSLQRSRGVGRQLRRTVTATLSNVDKGLTSSQDKIQSMAGQIRALTYDIQPGTWRYENTEREEIEAVDSTYNPVGTDATFTLDIDDKVLDIFAVILRVKTTPLVLRSYYTYRQVAVSGSLSTNPVVHDHTIPDGPLTELYNVLRSDNFPSIETLTIDGTDYTSQLGGPWNSGINDALDFTLDITDILKALPGGFQRPIDIVFTAEPRSGDVSIVAGPTITSDSASQGIIALTVRGYGIAQGIVRTTDT